MFIGWQTKIEIKSYGSSEHFCYTVNRFYSKKVTIAEFGIVGMVKLS